MSGLRKAKHYDWKDSNLALFGSDLEKNVSLLRRSRSYQMLLCPRPRQYSACVFYFRFSAQFPLLPGFKQVKREAAGKEKAWQGAGEKVGVQIWRIVNFKVRVERYHKKLSTSLNTC